MKDLIEISDEKTKNKLIKDGVDLDLFGCKIGDLKKLMKKFGIKKNNKIAKELIATNNYDAVYLGYLCMDVSTIEKEYLIELIAQSKYYKLRINSLAYTMAEHPDYQFFIDYLKNIMDDVNQSIYYAVLAGRLIIDPNYQNEEVLKVCHHIADNINSSEYQSMPETRNEMNSLIGYAGMQIPKYSVELIELFNGYHSDYVHELTNRRNANQASFIQMCIDRSIQAKKRKSCRC